MTVLAPTFSSFSAAFRPVSFYLRYQARHACAGPLFATARGIGFRGAPGSETGVLHRRGPVVRPSRGQNRRAA